MDIGTKPGRLKFIVQAAVAGVLTLSLADLGRFSFTPDARINAAFPESPLLAAQIKNAHATLTGSQASAVREELVARRKERALGCAKGISPGWGAAAQEVRRRITDTACFARVDDETTRWLGMTRVGPVLALPALSPLPKQIKFPARPGLRWAYFADKAGVALLNYDDAYGLIDLNSSKTLYWRQVPDDFFGALSPNGRLFLVGEGGRLTVRMVEGGAVIAAFPKVRYDRFFWLDDNTAVYAEGDALSRLIDFNSLQETELPGIRGLSGVLPVPGRPNQFVAGDGRGASKFEIDRSGAELKVRSVQRFYGAPTGKWTGKTSSPTSDGKYFVTPSERLEILALDTLEVDSVDLGQFRPQRALGTGNPDLVFMTGSMKFAPDAPSRCYVFSISRRALDEASCEFHGRSPIFIPGLRKLGFVTRSGLEVAEELAMPSVPLHDQVLAWQEEGVQAQLATNQPGNAVAADGHGFGEGILGEPIATPDVLYKCQGEPGVVVYQVRPCPPGKELERMESRKARQADAPGSARS